MPRYHIENRHQDEGWESSDLEFDSFDLAFAHAKQMACEAMICGMVRIVDTASDYVLATWSAGGGRRKDEPAYHPQWKEIIGRDSRVVECDPDDEPSRPSVAPPIDDVGPAKCPSRLGGLLRRIADWADRQQISPGEHPDHDASRMRVVSYREVGHCTYEVVSESAKHGRVTQNVLILPHDAIVSPAAQGEVVRRRSVHPGV